jgi:hypothetical protein
LAPADQICGLETIHDGHFNVEDDYGKVLREYTLKRVVARPGRHQVALDASKGRLDRDEVARFVVDGQYADGVGQGHQSVGLPLLSHFAGVFDCL